MLSVRHLSLRDSLALSSERITAQGFWIVTFAILTAAGAQLEIPVQPVPFTLQTFFVLLAGGVLGKRNATLSMILYLGLGLIGLPVFSGMGFGLTRLLGPTGGYLLSFPLAAFVVGHLISLSPRDGEGTHSVVARKIRRFGWTAGAMLIGLSLVFLFGTVQLYVVYFHDWGPALRSGFLIFSFWDVVKLVAAAAISQEFSRQ